MVMVLSSSRKRLMLFSKQFNLINVGPSGPPIKEVTMSYTEKDFETWQGHYNKWCSVKPRNKTMAGSVAEGKRNCLIKIVAIKKALRIKD